jgi:hypothetical protein
MAASLFRFLNDSYGPVIGILGFVGFIVLKTIIRKKHVKKI